MCPNAIAVGAARMMHVVIVDRDRAVSEIMVRRRRDISYLSQPGLRAYREKRRLHLRRDMLLDVGGLLPRPADVVPMVMGQDDKQIPDVFLLQHVVAEIDDAGSRVA